MVAVVVTAAGRSERFGGSKKEYADLGGRSVLDASVAPFLELPGLEVLVITAPEGGLEAARAALSAATLTALGDKLLIVEGGATRRDSVRKGLERAAETLRRAAGLAPEAALPATAIVLIHDGARPWASAGLARSVLEATLAHGAVVPVIPLTDTPKRIVTAAAAAATGATDGATSGAAPVTMPGRGGLILEHPARSGLGGAQTPQGFRLGPILDMHRRAEREGRDCTDDGELWAIYAATTEGVAKDEALVAWVEGEETNRKVTFRNDLAAGQDAHGREPGTERGADRGADDGAAHVAACPFRVGQGWDLHRLVAGRRLMLGGIEVPSDKGEEAHSDGDVLLHAIIDALLGAAALGDIGSHFPPSDPRWKDADSRDLAARAAALVREAGYEPVNLDCTVVLERPRLGPWKGAMCDSIARALGMDPRAVSVKAKTSEGVDAAGEGRAIEAYAAVILSARS